MSAGALAKAELPDTLSRASVQIHYVKRPACGLHADTFAAALPHETGWQRTRNGVATMTPRVSLAELESAGIRLCPDEAAAVVAELCRQYTSGQLSCIPSPGIIRVTDDGEVLAQGPMTTGAAGVREAARLLDDLLPDFEVPPPFRASGGLRLVVARALGTLDLPPYETIDDFRAALGRFAVPDLAVRARRLYRRWEEARANLRPAAPAPAALDISDIRRARRATGLSLDDLSAAADVRAARLRELEWGDFRHWRADEEARALVARYARAAGLDEDVVLSIAWPMIEQAVAVGAAASEPVTALVPAGAQALVTVEHIARPRDRSRLASWALVGAAAALAALGTFGVAMESSQGGLQAQETRVPAVPREAPPIEPSPATAEARPIEPSPATAEVRPIEPSPATAASAAAAAPVVASAPRDSTRIARRPGTERQRARPAAAVKKRPPARHKSFFGRELFRIVIR